MKWIKVEDKLPEYNKDVLCYYFPKQPLMEGRIIGILKRHNIEEAGKNNIVRRMVDKNGFALCAEVTHWMPIPDKPKD